MRSIIRFTTIIVLTLAGITLAQDTKPLPPIKPIERLLPPKGIVIAKEEREKLEARLATITKAIAAAKLDAKLQPDVEIYTKAVRWALDFDEFYDAKKDVAKAHAALDSAQKRLDELKQNKSSWTTQRGLLARGYRSDIDDSVQPYGLHIPANLDLSKPVPLLVWLHGRGDKETDLHFITTREKNKGEFAPDWCITLHPYGRGTIGFKFAGEIDVLDAIASVHQRYKIDADRVALAGFSMGGAGAWHIGAHYADRFCVVHAGAGFVETAKYNKLTPDKYPAWYEQKLWGWYDVPNYTRNLFNVPVIAYSGEKDKQIQAAREMEAAFKAEGRELNHIIGPGFEHKYEPKAKEEILKQIKAAVDKGMNDWPKKVSLQTRSLDYATLFWVGISQFDESWSDARLDVEVVSPSEIDVHTKNVKAFYLAPRNEKISLAGKVKIKINGEIACDLDVAELRSSAWFYFRKGMWEFNSEGIVITPAKDHGDGGPIDAAFCTSFMFVEPTGSFSHPRVQRWVSFEMERARSRWRSLMRGDPRIKKDVDITEEDIQNHSLVIWGDPTSNRLFGRFGKDMPIKWTADRITVGDQQFDASSHVPLLTYTHQITQKLDENSTTHWKEYIVLNSGPTFREGHDRTNSQQTPKLPDWAIIGLDKDPDAFAPGEIKAAGFFDENWKVKPQPEGK